MFAPKVQARGHHVLMPFPSFQNIDVALETCFWLWKHASKMEGITFVILRRLLRGYVYTQKNDESDNVTIVIN